MGQGPQAGVAPESLPADFFDKPQGAPDRLPADFFDKSKSAVPDTLPADFFSQPSGKVTSYGQQNEGIRRVVAAARKAGFSGEALVKAVAIAMAESGGNPRAANRKAPDDSHGLWQVNYIGNLRADRTRKFGPPEAQYDPDTNARAAYQISGGGKNFNPWTTYTGGKYKAYEQQAREAVAQGGGPLPKPKLGPPMSPQMTVQKDLARRVQGAIDKFPPATRRILTGMIERGEDFHTVVAQALDLSAKGAPMKPGTQGPRREVLSPQDKAALNRAVGEWSQIAKFMASGQAIEPGIGETLSKGVGAAVAGIASIPGTILGRQKEFAPGVEAAGKIGEFASYGLPPVAAGYGVDTATALMAGRPDQALESALASTPGFALQEAGLKAMGKLYWLGREVTLGKNAARILQAEKALKASGLNAKAIDEVLNLTRSAPSVEAFARGVQTGVAPTLRKAMFGDLGEGALPKGRGVKALPQNASGAQYVAQPAPTARLPGKAPEKVTGQLGLTPEEIAASQKKLGIKHSVEPRPKTVVETPRPSPRFQPGPIDTRIRAGAIGSKEIPNARKIESSTPVHGDVRARQGQAGGEVPTAGSGQGVRQDQGKGFASEGKAVQVETTAPEVTRAVREADDTLPGVRMLPDDVKRRAMARAQARGVGKQGAVSVEEYESRLKDMGLNSREAARLARKGTLTPMQTQYLGHLYDEVDKAARSARDQLDLAIQHGDKDAIAKAQAKADDLESQAVDVLRGFTHGTSETARALRMSQELESGVLNLSRAITWAEKRSGFKLSDRQTKEIRDAHNLYQQARANVNNRNAPSVAKMIDEAKKEAFQTRRDAAWKRIRERTAQASSGFDPRILADYADIGASYIAEGVYEFRKFSDRLIREVHENAKVRLTVSQAREVYNKAWQVARRDIMKGADHGADVRIERGPFGPKGGMQTFGIQDPEVLAARRHFLEVMRKYDRTRGWEVATNFLRNQRLLNPFSRISDVESHIVRGIEGIGTGPTSAIVDAALFPKLRKSEGAAVRVPHFRELSVSVGESLQNFPRKWLEYMKHGEDAPFIRHGESGDLLKYDARRESNTGLKWFDAWQNAVSRFTGTTDITAKDSVRAYTMMEQAGALAERDLRGAKNVTNRKAWVRNRQDWYLTSKDPQAVAAREEMALIAEDAAIQFTAQSDNLISAGQRGAFTHIAQTFGPQAAHAAKFTSDMVFAFPRIFWEFSKWNLRAVGGAGEAAVRIAAKKIKGDPFTIQDRRQISKLVGANLVGLTGYIGGKKMVDGGLFDGTQIDSKTGRINWPTWAEWTIRNIPGASALILQGAGERLIERANMTPKQKQKAMYVLRGQIATNQPLFTGMRDIENAMTSGESLEEFLAKKIGALVIPGGVREAAYKMDEAANVKGRQVHGFIEQGRSQIPGLRQGLPPRT